MSCYILLYHSILHWIIYIYMYIILSHTIWDHIHSYPIIFSYYHIILACYPIIFYHLILYSQHQIISTSYHFPFISVSSSKHLQASRTSPRPKKATAAAAPCGHAPPSACPPQTARPCPEWRWCPGHPADPGDTGDPGDPKSGAGLCSKKWIVVSGQW